MPSFRLTLAYDGTDFAGSQIQPKQRTVQGVLERALTTVLCEPIRVTFGGRTDRGVHAIGQVAAVRLPTWRRGAETLHEALNANLPDDLVVARVAACDDSFHPRFDAIWREYRYWIAPSIISPFVRRYAWTPRAPVAIQPVVSGANWLVGTRDFASFASGGEGVPWSERARRPRGTTRTVLRCDCREIAIREGPGANRRVPVIEIAIAADAFLPRMVRNIVGALVEVGQGRQEPSWIADVLARRDRRLGSVVAPPQGLTLVEIGYAQNPIRGSVVGDFEAGVAQTKERFHGTAHVVAETR